MYRQDLNTNKDLLMKRIYILQITALLALGLVSCNKAGFGGAPVQGDMSLIGRAVNFDSSFAQEFTTRASTYNHTGVFNEGDVMTIYRQYWDDSIQDWNQTDFRVYHYKGTYASGGINISTDWRVLKGRTGQREDGSRFLQEEKDSLVWDNGKTVRFRAWNRSNLAGVVNSSDGVFYPDYSFSDWVTVSGPSQAIPLALKHVGCRLTFDEKAGNEISRVEICTALDDYLWDDNADIYENDQADKEEDAKSAQASVLSVYNKMCMPAGVDLDNYFIRTMTNALYDEIKAGGEQSRFPNKFADFEERCEAMSENPGIVSFGTMSPEYIATNVKRPYFIRLDGRSYMITSPYDMSNAATNGDVLVLPACTRFKIWLYDVNSGMDKEHIFALKDIKGKDGQPLFKDGLALLAGHSFLFRVGYQYDSFTVDVLENDMAWDNGGSSQVNAEQDIPQPDDSNYGWWKTALYNAAKEAKGTTKNFDPVFEIANETQFEEFVKIVNGTSGFKTSGLAKARRAVDNPEADPDLDNKDEKRMYWYRTEDESGRSLLPIGPADTIWVTKAQAISEGYLFYREYHPMISTETAFSEDDYLRGPYSFYHEELRAHFTVKVTADIDFKDRLVNSVGITADKAFRGYFDAQMHKFSNMNVQGEYLFGYAQDADIRNLVIESMRPVSILNQGKSSSTESMHIVGISLTAPCTNSPIANTLVGSDSNNGRSYVIACIYQGNSAKPLVGEADNMTMYGCMNIAENVSGAALLGAGNGLARFKPQANKVSWNGYFECNYFLRENGTPSKTATPITGNASKDYKPQQYIRGARSYILRAVTDNLLAGDITFDKLPKDDNVRENYYGLAPYKAMNYAIEVEYNLKNDNANLHPCMAHYAMEKSGYGYHYPALVSGRPASGTDYDKNPVAQNN